MFIYYLYIILVLVMLGGLSDQFQLDLRTSSGWSLAILDDFEVPREPLDPPYVSNLVWSLNMTCFYWLNLSYIGFQHVWSHLGGHIDSSKKWVVSKDGVFGQKAAGRANSWNFKTTHFFELLLRPSKRPGTCTNPI